MRKNNKNPKPTRRFYFWRKTLSLSDLNVPRKSKIAIDALRTLSLIPSFLGFVYNSKQALHVPLRDAGGAIIIQSSQIDYVVASFWCALAGYWNWILTTSMMRRWIFHYEMSSAIVRLITFIVITWCISAWVNSKNGPDQPIRTWMMNCFILLITDIIRLSIVSDPKYHGKASNIKDSNLFLQLTIMKVLILPMSVATCLSVVAVLYQMDQLQYTTSQLMIGPALLNNQSSYSEIGHTTSILILIISSWSTASFDRRHTLRKTSLRLLSHSPLSVQYRFVIGQPPSAKDKLLKSERLLKESEIYQDLLMVQSSDVESDKSRKVFEAMRWANTINHEYILKANDDVFVRWDIVLNEMSQLQQPSYYWRGLVYRDIPVQIMNSKSLFIDYSLPTLPHYTHSLFYILSRDVLNLIVTPSSPRRFIQEDGQNIAVWLFGFHIKPIHDRRIQDTDTCENDLIAKRMDKASDMLKMYYNIIHDRLPCTGFVSSLCAICYSCKDKKMNWQSINLACDSKKGIMLKEMSGFAQVVGKTPY
ncbi:galactosyltransferase-domain-containing protein [Cokeromyces recurvatus]|uniref:galactosyltransferase-domain-containing protein n=1 Tax=Cokeromyces recurvatus TaxID=90255 RepID=UPI00221FCD2A|nr:galactosyltransferase-domain-containing protein [Cokeromyces recurvatus]KAI7902082.1 galactosyltransferase-domain-containing protein [Cokeromyces recurvatus]